MHVSKKKKKKSVEIFIYNFAVKASMALVIAQAHLTKKEITHQSPQIIKGIMVLNNSALTYRLLFQDHPAKSVSNNLLL